MTRGEKYREWRWEGVNRHKTNATNRPCLGLNLNRPSIKRVLWDSCENSNYIYFYILCNKHWHIKKYDGITILFLKNECFTKDTYCENWKLFSRVWLCNLIDYAIHGILQARILEWVDFPFSRGSFQPRIERKSPTLWADSLLTELSPKV